MPMRALQVRESSVKHIQKQLDRACLHPKMASVPQRAAATHAEMRAGSAGAARENGGASGVVKAAARGSLGGVPGH
jgi:hypothetical protein